MDDPLRSRHDYDHGTLDDEDVAADPLEQFRRWLDDAVTADGLTEPLAMVLGTVDPDGTPSARTVLPRGLDTGFCFYTNRRSAKGRALAHRPEASLLFPWYALDRQVIVRGGVDQLPDADSDAYFASRPWGSRIAARASAQSDPVASRADLDAAVAAEAERHPEGTAVPRPPHWGGYRLTPRTVEFWQGRPSRLHDRLRYRRDAGRWGHERLQP